MTSIANIDWSLEMAASALDKHAVSDHFSRAAHSYDEHAILQLAVGRSLVQRLPQRLPVNAALDLGCATAPFARAQQQVLPEAHWQAVDLSRAMLHEAADRKSVV